MEKKKTKYQKDISTLKSFLFEGEYDHFLDLANKIKKEQHDPDGEKLLDTILKESSYLFAFQSLSTSVDEINFQRKKRQKIFLSILGAEGQWKVLSSTAFDEKDLDQDIIDFVRPLDNYKNQTIWDSLAIVCQSLLYQNKKQEIEIIKAKTPWNFKEKTAYFYFHHGNTKGSHGSFLVDIKNSKNENKKENYLPFYFCAWLNIKKTEDLDFFVKHGVSVEEIYKLKKDIDTVEPYINYIKEYNDKVKQQLNLASSIMEHYLLSCHVKNTCINSNFYKRTRKM